MNVDRRLHRAARELRGVDISVPPIAPPARRGTRTLLAVAASVLVLAGAASVVVSTGVPGDRSNSEVTETTSTGLHPLDEIDLIDGIAAEHAHRPDRPVRPLPPGVV